MQSCASTGVCLRADLAANYSPTTEKDARRQKTKLTNKLNRQGYTVNGDTRVWHLYVIELDDAVGPRVDDRFSLGPTSERLRENPKTASSNTRAAPVTEEARSTPRSYATVTASISGAISTNTSRCSTRQPGPRLPRRNLPTASPASLGYSVEGGH